MFALFTGCINKITVWEQSLYYRVLNVSGIKQNAYNIKLQSFAKTVGHSNMK